MEIKTILWRELPFLKDALGKLQQLALMSPLLYLISFLGGAWRRTCNRRA